jgi:hypothetical protein
MDLRALVFDVTSASISLGNATESIVSQHPIGMAGVRRGFRCPDPSPATRVDIALTGQFDILDTDQTAQAIERFLDDL